MTGQRQSLYVEIDIRSNDIMYTQRQIKSIIRASDDEDDEDNATNQPTNQQIGTRELCSTVLSVLAERPNREDISVVGIRDHTVSVEDAGDVLLRPVPILLLHRYEKARSPV